MTTKPIALVVALIGFASLAFAQAPPQPPEPVYQGKPLSSWLRDYPTPESDEALRQAGTNAIPTLERMLREEDQDWLPPGEFEPVYQGKRLSEWLKGYVHAGRIPESIPEPEETRQLRRNADEAVLQAGIGAIPTLLRMLRARDSALKLKLIALAQKEHFTTSAHTPADELNLRALEAFVALGSEAQNAVPTLVGIVEQNISPSSQRAAILALGFIGPSAKEAVPSLLRWATNADWEVRSATVHVLGAIHAQPNRVVPVLANALHDPVGHVRDGAVMSLGQFGPGAALAVPSLVEYLRSPQNSVWKPYAADVLKAIDPEAAAKAGVK